MTEKLKGIEAIADFCHVEHDTLLTWRRDFHFPMKTGFGGATWTADAGEIQAWFKERNLTPKTATSERLQNFEILKAEAAGKGRKFNKKLTDANKIAEFMGVDILTVLDWAKNWIGCPIQKKPGSYIADADELVKWFSGIRLRTIQEGKATK
jgi:transposase-like protein